MLVLKQLLQVDFSIVKEAHLQVAICRQSDPVAPTTEVLAHGANVAELALVARYFVTFRS